MSHGEPRTPPLEGLDSHSERFQLDAHNKARSGGKSFGKLLTFGRSPKTATTPGTPEGLALTADDLLIFSEASHAALCRCACAAAGRGSRIRC
jgi:hypothetical protein